MHSRRVPRWHPDHPDYEPTMSDDDDDELVEVVVDDDEELAGLWRVLAGLAFAATLVLSVGLVFLAGLAIYWLCFLILHQF